MGKQMKMSRKYYFIFIIMNTVIPIIKWLLWISWYYYSDNSRPLIVKMYTDLFPVFSVGNLWHFYRIQWYVSISIHYLVVAVFILAIYLQKKFKDLTPIQGRNERKSPRLRAGPRVMSKRNGSTSHEFLRPVHHGTCIYAWRSTYIGHSYIKF